eukprot:scaffold25830_cov101-Isochrysis_galbana.AAC.3
MPPTWVGPRPQTARRGSRRRQKYAPGLGDTRTGAAPAGTGQACCPIEIIAAPPQPRPVPQRDVDPGPLPSRPAALPPQTASAGRDPVPVRRRCLAARDPTLHPRLAVAAAAASGPGRAAGTAAARRDFDSREPGREPELDPDAALPAPGAAFWVGPASVVATLKPLSGRGSLPSETSTLEPGQASGSLPRRRRRTGCRHLRRAARLTGVASTGGGWRVGRGACGAACAECPCCSCGRGRRCVPGVRWLVRVVHPLPIGHDRLIFSRLLGVSIHARADAPGHQLVRRKRPCEHREDLERDRTAVVLIARGDHVNRPEVFKLGKLECASPIDVGRVDQVEHLGLADPDPQLNQTSPEAGGVNSARSLHVHAVKVRTQSLAKLDADFWAHVGAQIPIAQLELRPFRGRHGCCRTEAGSALTERNRCCYSGGPKTKLFFLWSPRALQWNNCATAAAAA